MPIYDYSCGKCGQVTEVIHGINDHGPRFCPSCGTEGAMRKALTAPAIVFKGSGWAKVDRRSSSGGSSTRPSAKPTSTKGTAGSTSASDGGSARDAGSAGSAGAASTEASGKTSPRSGDGGGD